MSKVPGVLKAASRKGAPDGLDVHYMLGNPRGTEGMAGHPPLNPEKGQRTYDRIPAPTPTYPPTHHDLVSLGFPCVF